MALFRKFFYRKPPDGLLEISERVYVFDCCFTTDVLEEDEYEIYIEGIVGQLHEHFPDASFMVFNFREGENQSRIGCILSQHDMTVMDYPRQYEGCPLLTMEMIHHFLRSSESWLSLGQQNILLMHCEHGGWPVLAFMLAALLIYRKQYTGEQKTSDMIYKQAPRELLQLMSPLNPLPSQLRYLQYISRRNVGSVWPPLDRALTLDCIIIRFIPNFDGEGGCRPIFRIYGPDPLTAAANRTPKVLFSTPKRSKIVRQYKQADCELVKIDIHCHIQGDVVLECISLDNDLECEEMMFRVMFNTAFIRSNILILNRDEIDIVWNAKDQFPKDFRVEVLFSEMDSAPSLTPTIDLPRLEDKEGLPIEAFAKVQEIFSNVDWLESKTDVANVLQQIASSNILQEKFDIAVSHHTSRRSSLSQESFPEKLELLLELSENDFKSPKLIYKGKKSDSSFDEPSTDANSIPKRPELSSCEPSIDTISTKKIETSASFESSMGADCMWKIEPSPLFEPSIDANSRKSIDSSPLAADESSKSKNIELRDLHIALQRPALSKIISPRVPQTSQSISASHSSSPIHVSRYHSAPSALGITALLQDHAASNNKEKCIYPTATSPPAPSTPTPSDSKVPKSAHASHLCTPLTPSLKSSEDMLTTKHLEPMSDNRDQKLTIPPSPPFSPLVGAIKSSLSTPSTPSPPPTFVGTINSSIPPPPPLPPSPSPPLPKAQPFSTIENSVSCPSAPPPIPSSLLLESSPSSNVKSLLKTPSSPPSPPPPLLRTNLSSTVQTLSSVPPPPPPLPGLPKADSPGSSSSILQNSASSPPPPPLTPQISGLSSSPTVTNSAPPPPPPLRHSGLASFPLVTNSAPPPPPSPNSASKDSLPNNSGNVPPVPPPPAAFPNGLSKTGRASPQSHSGVSNGNVPPIPGPPSGALFSSKGCGLSRTIARSQAHSKRSNLKPYHWLKLTRAVQGSLWAETQKHDEASKAPEFDMSELESLFSAATPNSDHGGVGGRSNRRASGPKSEKIQLIELRRAYNCEIMLTKVKIPLPDLMGSVLQLDDSALDVDQVENLIKFCPSKEEVETLKNYNGDKENLGKCEQFFLELMKVPRVESKLRVFSFKIQFLTQVSELRRDLNIVNSASEEIRTSVKLKRIMQTILSLGNALNHGTARGSAIGFRLDSLLKLTDTRAWNNKMTLMHYLCKVLADKLPELLDFPKDLTSLEASTKIQLKYLAEEMQAITKGIEKVAQEFTKSENDGPVLENFCKILKEFLSDAEGEVRSLASLYSNVGRNADALALYFGEDPARVPFEQVVSTLLNFVRMFVRAHGENCKQLEYERKKAEKEAENEKLKLNTRRESEHVIQAPMKNGNINY